MCAFTQQSFFPGATQSQGLQPTHTHTQQHHGPPTPLPKRQEEGRQSGREVSEEEVKDV